MMLLTVKNLIFVLQQYEIDLIKELAEKNGQNKSRFIAECVSFWKENH